MQIRRHNSPIRPRGGELVLEVGGTETTFTFARPQDTGVLLELEAREVDLLDKIDHRREHLLAIAAIEQKLEAIYEELEEGEPPDRDTVERIKRLNAKRREHHIAKKTGGEVGPIGREELLMWWEFVAEHTLSVDPLSDAEGRALGWSDLSADERVQAMAELSLSALTLYVRRIRDSARLGNVPRPTSGGPSGSTSTSPAPAPSAPATPPTTSATDTDADGGA